MANAFHKADCITCGRKTWHFKDGDKPARCTDHSNFTPGQQRKHLADIVQGGSLYSRKELPTEREIRIANRLDRTLWRMSEEKRIAQVDVSGEDWAAGLFEEMPTLDPSKTYCSFCNEPVDKINTLTERKPTIRMIDETYLDSEGQLQVQTKVTSKVETQHACPKCVLNIRKPIVVRKV